MHPISSQTAQPILMKLSRYDHLCLRMPGKKFDLDRRPFDLRGHLYINFSKDVHELLLNGSANLDETFRGCCPRGQLQN